MSAQCTAINIVQGNQGKDTITLTFSQPYFWGIIRAYCVDKMGHSRPPLQKLTEINVLCKNGHWRDWNPGRLVYEVTATTALDNKYLPWNFGSKWHVIIWPEWTLKPLYKSCRNSWRVGVGMAIFERTRWKIPVMFLG